MSDRLEVKTRFRDDEFPLKLIHIPDQGEVRLHRHDFRELVVVHAGQGEHCWEEEVYPLEAGDVFVLTEDQRHGYRRTAGLVLTNVIFQPRRLPFLRGDLVTLPGYHALFHLEPRYRRKHAFASRLRLSPEGLARIAGLLQELATELDDGRPGYQTLAIAAFMRLVTALSRAYPRPKSEPQTQLFALGRLLSTLEARFTEPWSLEALAAQASLSRRHFQRLFREAVGKTPNEYLIELRLNRAKELLAESASIKEIAALCGYRDTNYFVRQFRERLGLSPNRYRERLRADQ